MPKESEEILNFPGGTFFGRIVEGDKEYAHTLAVYVKDVLIETSRKINDETKKDYHEDFQEWLYTCLVRFVFTVKNLNISAAKHLIQYINHILLEDDYIFLGTELSKIIGLLKEIEVTHGKRWTIVD